MHNILAHDLESAQESLTTSTEYKPSVSFWKDDRPIGYCMYAGDSGDPFGESSDLAALIVVLQPEQLVTGFEAFFSTLSIAEGEYPTVEDIADLPLPSEDPNSQSALILNAYGKDGPLGYVMQPFGVNDDGTIDLGEVMEMDEESIEALSSRMKAYAISIQIGFKMQEDPEKWDVNLRQKLMEGLAASGWLVMVGKDILDELGLEGMQL